MTGERATSSIELPIVAAAGGRIAARRLDSIDALRGVAALMVALYHIWGHYGVYPWPSLGVVPQTLGAPLFSYLVSPLRWGYLGVSLFLVLSGFCIHLPFARKRSETGRYQFKSREFYLRRMWRLYPAYLVSVVGTYLLLLAASSVTTAVTRPEWQDLLAHLTLTHGYIDSYFYGIVHVYWSLALEFQLYLAYPLFLYLFRRVGLTRSVMLLTAVSIAWRYAALLHGFGLISISTGGPYSAMGCILARMPEWLFGVWLAEWFASDKHLEAKRLPLLGLSIFTLLVSVASTLSESTWGLTDILFGIGFAALIGACVVPGKRVAVEAKAYRLLVWIGVISYSLYLFHMQLSWLLRSTIDKVPGDVAQFALRTVVLVVSIPVIAVIYRRVEQPFLRAPRAGDTYFSLYEKLRKVIGIKKDTGMPVQFGSSAS